MEKELPHWLRRPLLGLYVWTFGCNMEEAELEDLREYTSFMALFTRELKEGARTISPEYPLVSEVLLFLVLLSQTCVIINNVRM